jgi:hypothetical protein
MSAPIAFNSENYNALNQSIIDIIKSGKRALINIYTDSAGNTLASDSHGEIKDREVLSASYTESYKDADGNMTNPFVVVKFKDSKDMIKAEFIDYFTNVDYVDDHWYTLSTATVPMKTFGPGAVAVPKN